MSKHRDKPRRPRQTRDRDGGQFIALPWVVQDSPGWRSVSHSARCLLLDIIRTGRNGHLATARARLKVFGWKSQDSIVRYVQQLTEAGLLVQTLAPDWVSHRAALYAVTWCGLEDDADLEMKCATFNSVHRGAYMTSQAKPRPSRGFARSTDEAENLGPQYGPKKAANGPQYGPGKSPVGPQHGPLEPKNGARWGPQYGPLLERSHLGWRSDRHSGAIPRSSQGIAAPRRAKFLP